MIISESDYEKAETVTTAVQQDSIYIQEIPREDELRDNVGLQEYIEAQNSGIQFVSTSTEHYQVHCELKIVTSFTSLK